MHTWFQTAAPPWDDEETVLERIGFRDMAERRCNTDTRALLPRSMRFLIQAGVSYDEGHRAAEESISFLVDHEMPKWLRRQARCIQLGLSTDAEMRRLLDPGRNPQPWIIYDTERGGLPDIECSPDDPEARSGVIPCSAVRHHAVAWWRNADGHVRTCLLSGRGTGVSFEMDSDIGHEGVHAAFSPVPLFSQTMEERSRAVPFSAAVPGSMTHEQRARFAYTLCEVGLAMLRGEPRPTPTGLINIEEWEDARAFLRIAHSLMPGLGFGHALEMTHDRDTPIGIDEPVFFAIGIATLRAMWHLAPHVNSCEPPEETWYRSVPNY